MTAAAGVPRTLFTILEETTRQYPDRVALFQPIHGSRKDAPQYQTYSWTQFRDIAAEIGLGLAAHGVRHADTVAIYSETRAEFYLVDFGVMSIGAVSAGLYTAISMQEQAVNIRNCKPRAIVVENSKSLRALSRQ